MATDSNMYVESHNSRMIIESEVNMILALVVITHSHSAFSDDEFNNNNNIICNNSNAGNRYRNFILESDSYYLLLKPSNNTKKHNASKVDNRKQAAA